MFLPAAPDDMQTRYDHLDDLLTRLHMARQRPAWRERLLDGADPVASVATLRALRAVEHHQQIGAGASIGDVAEYLAVEHSTASRTVSGLVAAGLLAKSAAADDQRRSVLMLTELGTRALATVTERRRELVAETVADWPSADVDVLVGLLERLTDRFEVVTGR
ncbi:MarR family winged helix-turn-helix transcriptional regulator [Mycolicibacterium diernhoferi]|nr:MarR family winged helix-turn-helix transcriptional regulator [Mycolicibacterium diernhoferi]